MRRLYLCSLAMALLVMPISAQQETHCQDTFLTDIGSLMFQPNGSFQTVTRNCSGNPSCDDYFDISCPQGAQLTLTFCSNGGTANFDTGISVWSGGSFDFQEGCNDDACAGFLSTLVFDVPATGDYRVRIGSQELSEAGSYILAYQAPESCEILGAIPVELQSIEIE